jgi:dipeptidase D
MSRVLDELLHLSEIRLGSIRGGTKRNAIPRESEAIVYLKNDQREVAERTIHTMRRQLMLELKETDPGLTIKMTELTIPPTGFMFTEAFQDKVINLLLAMPHGMLAMSQDIEGLVETRTNLAVIKPDENYLAIETSQRSSVESAKHHAARQVEALMMLAGAETNFENSYPGWTPNMESQILATCRKVYKTITGEDMQVKAVHAGLECGIIGERYKDMDMISFGLLIENAHSPDERVSIPSVERF